MKKRIRTKENTNKHIFCSVCGITKETIDILNDTNVDLEIPYIEEECIPDLGISHICSYCREYISNFMWEKYLTKKYKFPMFFHNVKKDIKEFLEINSQELKDMGSDYTAIAHLHEALRERIKKIQKKNGSSPDSITKGIPIATTRDIYEFMEAYNNGKSEDNLSSMIDASFTMLPEDVDSDERCPSELAAFARGRKDLCFIELTVTKELMFEDKVTFNLGFLGINETMSDKNSNKDKDSGIDFSIPTGGFKID